MSEAKLASSSSTPTAVSPSSEVRLLPQHSYAFVGAMSVRVVRGVCNVFGYELSAATSASSKSHLLVSTTSNTLTLNNNSKDKDNVCDISLTPHRFVVSDDGLSAPSRVSPSVAAGVWFGGLKENPEAPLHYIRFNDNHEQFAQSLCSHANPVVMFCGGQNCGKSTFSRYCVNRLLSAHGIVAFIETDVGQCELSPAGLMSLHILEEPLCGQPFHHQHFHPELSHFLGENNPGKHMRRYKEYVTSLIAAHRRLCEQKQKFIPLVINTHGWIIGAGKSLLQHIMNTSRPTHIAEMRLDSSDPQLLQPKHGECDYSIISRTPATVATSTATSASSQPSQSKPSKSAGKPAKRIRHITLLSYLTSHLQQTNLVLQETAKTMQVVTASRQYAGNISADITIRNLQDAVLVDVKALKVGSILGLLEETDGVLPNCRGLALFIEYDEKNHQLRIVTPVHELQRINRIVLGLIELAP